MPAGPSGPPSIRYQISYDRNYQSLRVTVAQCRDLKKQDVGLGKIDPYVKVYLMPGNYQVEKTKTQKKNFNPTFNETFTYQLPVVDVPSKTVVLQVVDWDMMSKDDAVGEVQVPLWDIDLYSQTDQWKELHAPTGTAGQVSDQITAWELASTEFIFTAKTQPSTLAPGQ